MKQNLFFMQNNAFKHAAKYTREELENKDIHVINWSSYSFDLNLIEAVLNCHELRTEWNQDEILITRF